MTRYFYDTEFHEDGHTIELISIGIVADDGRELYAINDDLDDVRLQRHDWLAANVWPSLPRVPASGVPERLDRDHPDVHPKHQIAQLVRNFLLADGEPELWAWYAAYDHVALCQLWGRMIDLPDGLPMYTHDLKQEVDRLGSPSMPEQETGEHNALADARHVRAMWHYAVELAEEADHA